MPDRTEPTRRTNRPPNAAPRGASVEERLENEVQASTERPGVRHAIVGVRSADGALDRVFAAGAEEGEPVHPDAPYWIASVTKAFVATVVLQLVEEEAVDLDAPLAAYLASARLRGLHVLDGVDRSEWITVRQALHHASGLPDHLEVAPEGAKGVLTRVAEGEDLGWTLDDALDRVRDATPHFPPQALDGRRHRVRYSDTNFQLLIAVVEAVTGDRFGAALQARVFGPAGMTATWLPEDGDDGPVPLPVRADDAVLRAPAAMRAFRDLVSTAADQLAFLQALHGGRLFRDPTTLEAMHGGWCAFPFSLNPRPTAPTWPIAYGLGAMRIRLPRVLSPLKPFPTLVGHTGVSGSWAFYEPATGLATVGTVDQFAAAALPFRFAPKLAEAAAT